MTLRETTPAPSAEAHGCYSVAHTDEHHTDAHMYEAPPAVLTGPGGDYLHDETPTLKHHPMKLPAAMLAVLIVLAVLGGTWALLIALGWWVVS